MMLFYFLPIRKNNLIENTNILFNPTKEWTKKRRKFRFQMILSIIEF